MIDTFKDRVLLHLTNKQMQLVQEQDVMLDGGNLPAASKLRMQGEALSELEHYILSGALDDSK